MVRVKCKVSHVHGEGRQRDVIVNPVYAPDPKSPDWPWVQAFPVGEFRLTLTDAEQFETFKVGAVVYVDFHTEGPPPGVED